MTRVSSALVLAALLAGCAGPPIPAAVEGEPLCPDFALGVTKTKMVGGLRQPLTLTIKDDDVVVFRATLRGRRSEDGGRVRTALPDDDTEYTVEWAQCANERAPEPVDAAPSSKGAATTATYECGEAKVYLTATLATVKGDANSHVLKVPPPPNPACWVGEAPPPPPPPPPPAPEPPDAGAPDAAASPSASASAAPPPPAAGPAPKPASKPSPPMDKGDTEGAVIQE